MTRFRMSGLLLGAAFLAMLLILLGLKDALVEAHVDDTILKFASDASIYWDVYEAIYANLDLSESPALFLVGSPVLFMKLSGGNLFIVEICNLALMLLCLRVGVRMLSTFQARMLFIGGALGFPYFLFGFLGLNKEVYAMCSAILFGAYYIRGQRSHLWLALLLGACARYYMLIALIVLLVTVPREREPRYKLIVALLLTISLIAPIAKVMIPQYTAEGLLDDATFTGLLFSAIIDHGGYFLAYAVKYPVLMLARIYALFIGTSEDFLGGAVSFLSMLMLIVALRVLRSRRRPPGPLVKRLIIAGLFAPVPIMWSEIMHWRYYSFVYFFFLYALALHRQARPAVPAAPPARPEALAAPA